MTSPVRIPADVDLPDRILGPLTARQLAVFVGAALVLYLAWALAGSFVPFPVFFGLALPIGVAAGMLALAQRDGMPLDRLLLAAVRQRLAPRHQVPAPEGQSAAPPWIAHVVDHNPTSGASADRARPGVLGLPPKAVTDAGVVDLGDDGLALIAVAGTVNFALRTSEEQDALVATFGRYLHGLTTPVQLLVRTDRLDLTAQVELLRDRAAALPHPALEAAALEHAGFLADLDSQVELLRRQVLLVLREPLAGTVGHGRRGPEGALGLAQRIRRHRRGQRLADGAVASRRAAESRLVHRLREAVDLLAPAGITITPLQPHEAGAILASALNPEHTLPASPSLAVAGDVITTSTEPPWRETDEPDADLDLGGPAFDGEVGR